jgi:hypothetical protein
MPTPSSFRSSAVRLGRTVSSVILAERSLILSKAKAPQPNHDVHDDAPKRRNGYVLERVGLTLQRQIILLLLAKIHIPLQQHGDVCDQGERETDPVC